MKIKKLGRGSYHIATAPRFFMGAAMEMLRSRKPILRGKV